MECNPYQSTQASSRTAAQGRIAAKSCGSRLTFRVPCGTFLALWVWTRFGGCCGETLFLPLFFFRIFLVVCYFFKIRIFVCSGLVVEIQPLNC